MMRGRSPPPVEERPIHFTRLPATWPFNLPRPPPHESAPTPQAPASRDPPRDQPAMLPPDSRLQVTHLARDESGELILGYKSEILGANEHSSTITEESATSHDFAMVDYTYTLTPVYHPGKNQQGKPHLGTTTASYASNLPANPFFPMATLDGNLDDRPTSSGDKSHMFGHDLTIRTMSSKAAGKQPMHNYDGPSPYDTPTTFSKVAEKKPIPTYNGSSPFEELAHRPGNNIHGPSEAQEYAGESSTHHLLPIISDFNDTSLATHSNSASPKPCITALATASADAAITVDSTKKVPYWTWDEKTQTMTETMVDKYWDSDEDRDFPHSDTEEEKRPRMPGEVRDVYSSKGLLNVPGWKDSKFTTTYGPKRHQMYNLVGREEVWVGDEGIDEAKREEEAEEELACGRKEEVGGDVEMSTTGIGEEEVGLEAGMEVAKDPKEMSVAEKLYHYAKITVGDGLPEDTCRPHTYMYCGKLRRARGGGQMGDRSTQRNFVRFWEAEMAQEANEGEAMLLGDD
ncbi:Hypothetical protein D9617_21g096280 [Elsinoe fawcettii]|nr:Hypothetical protein D9617_21g096280 [Elsinoe fawcettii]